MISFGKIIKLLKNLYVNIVDFIFPPGKMELVLRSISYDEFILSVNKSPIPPFSFIDSLFAYKDPLAKELVWQIKYRKNKKAIKLAGKALYKSVLENNPYGAMLLPIPISKKRRRERGYNQCEFLIDEILQNDFDKKFSKDFNILKRVVHTDRQTLKGRSERISGSKDIFFAKSIEGLTNKRIVIIDDVVTTGSTARSARDCLLQNGYTNVRVLTIAR